MKYFVSERKRIFADISLKEVIEKAKNSNSVTKDVECKRIQTRLFTCAQECARLVCGKDRRGWSYTPTPASLSATHSNSFIYLCARMRTPCLWQG